MDFSQRTISGLFKTLAQAAQNWSLTVIIRAATVINSESAKLKGGGLDSNTNWQQLRPLVLGSLCAVILGSHQITPATGLTPEMVKKAEEVLMPLGKQWVPHHLEIAYVILAAALGLDEDVCRKEGLQIIDARTVGPDEAVRIGFCRKGIPPEHVERMARDGRLLTVRMAPDREDERLGLGENQDGSVLYEVERVEQQVSEKIAYKVFAVWVPTTRTPSINIGAVVDRVACDQEDGSSVDAFII